MTVFGLPNATFWVFVATLVAGNVAAAHYLVAHKLMGRPFSDEIGGEREEG